MKTWPRFTSWFTLRTFAGGLTARHWVALLVVPALLLGLFVVAFRDPISHLGQVQAAVVNNDEPVTVDGEIMPLGRELAASLVNDDDPNYAWILTNDDDAAAGLATGTYKVVVTIPKSFSKLATSIGDSDPLDATTAKIQVQSAADVPLADAAVGQILVDAARRSLGTTITENYLDNVYDGFNTMHDKLTTAVDGAATLADGSDALKAGTAKLRTGSASLANGAKKVSTGAKSLAKGASSLSSGAAKLSSGLNTLKSSTATLPSQTKSLATGAAQVADGTQQIEDAVVPATKTIISVINNSPDAHTVADELTDAAKNCSGTVRFCASLTTLAQHAQDDADEIEAAKTKATTKATSIQNDVTDLNDGAHQVADGAAALAKASTTLVKAISDAASGATKVASGAAALKTGAATLSSGASSLAGGASTLHTGVVAVDQGAATLASGAHTLSDGLAAAVKEVPTFTQAERDHLKAIVASPIATKIVGADGYSLSALALFAVLALWVAALVAFVMLPAMPRDVRISGRPTWLLALQGSLPGAGIGAVQGVVAALLLVAITGVSIGTFWLVLLAGLVTCATFMVVNRALVAAWQHWGRNASMAILALTAATAITSAQPSALQVSASYLPTTAALSMLRNSLSGNVSATMTSMAALLAWLGIGYLITLIITERSRVVSVGDLQSRPPAPWPYLAAGAG